MSHTSTSRMVSPLAQVLRTFRAEFIAVGVFSMVINLLMLVPTVYMLQVYDRVMVSHNVGTLLAISLVTLFLFAVMALAEWSRSRLLVRVGVRLDHQLSGAVFRKVFDTALSPEGGKRQRALQDLTELRQFLTGQGINAFFDAPWTPVYVAVSFMLHPMLGALSILFAVIQMALAIWGRRQQEVPARRVAEAQAEAQGFLQHKLRAADAVESMGMLPALYARWQERHHRYLALQADAATITHRVTGISKFVRYVQQSMSLCVGALLVIDGQLSPGSMIAANVLMSRALSPFDQMMGLWRAALSARSAYDRLNALLTPASAPEAAAIPTAPQGHLKLIDVAAHAVGREAPLIEHIDLDIHPATVTVVVGPSGSGKSTLARTLLGIWPDTRGEVLLDGRPLASYPRDQLGAVVGYLPQDVELMPGTIAENIARFGEVDSARVVAAAQAAGLHDMILRFPKGYDTPFDEMSGALSGGQMQRIALARAMYGTPRVLVLDEPNANLDEAGESALAQAVRAMREQGSAVVLITHRPGALALADRIVVMTAGRIRVDGPAADVLQQLRPARPTTAPAHPGTDNQKVVS